MDKNDEKQNLSTTSTSPSSPSSEKLGSVDHTDESSEENLSVPESLIGAENYLTLTEGKLCALTKEELTEAIDKCKLLILDSAVCSVERKWLVRRLIELRYQLLTVKEIGLPSEEEKNDEASQPRIVLGHHFTPRYQPTSTSKRFCDVCCCSIWNIVQSWYQCTDCRYRCHTKCVEQVIRPCVNITASEKPNYERKICPEVGMAAQNYQCAECKLTMSFKNTWLAPRLCDYTGLYYCTSCHWNNAAVIPARVFRNWEFQPHFVCRATYQLLRFTRNRPLIKLDPRLYGFVKELAEIKRMREEFPSMKSYLVRCHNAKPERKLLWKQFGNRSHLLEPSDLFSLRDLVEVHSGVLKSQMREMSDKFNDHITKSCTLCCGQGYRCELCDDKRDVIFPFYSHVYVCKTCSWVYHKTCWLKYQTCTKCERIKKKKQESSEISELTNVLPK